MIAEILFPHSETSVADPGRSDTDTATVGSQAEGETAVEVRGVERDIAGVALGWSSSPQQPRTDLAFVVCRRSVLEIRPRCEQGIGCLDPRTRRDVPIASRGVRKLGGVDRGVINRSIVSGEGRRTRGVVHADTVEPVPFTFLPHQVPVLPLLGRSRTGGRAPLPWDGVALVVGSMAPDFFYVTNGWGYSPWGNPLWFDGHRGSHLPIVVIMTLVVSWVIRRIVLAVVPLLAPDGGPLDINGYWFSSRRRPLIRWTVLSATVGVVSHLVLDAFTHSDGFVVRNVGWMQTSWLSVGSHNVTTSAILQYGGSVVGGCLALLMMRHLAAAGYLRRDQVVRSVPTLRPAGRGVVWGSVVVGVIAGALYANSRAGIHQFGDTTFVSGTSVVVFGFCWVAGPIIAGACAVARWFVDQPADLTEETLAFP